jgi:phosphohistidine phosphatase SixA
MDARRRAWVVAGAAALFLPAGSRAAEPQAWAALRKGGHVILLRHAATEPGLGDPPGYKLDNCATQRNLSEAGREQSRALGARLRAERVPIERVYTSPWCRCRETAQLAFGQAEDWEPLGSTFDSPHLEGASTETVKKRVLGLSIVKPRGNAVMVTHNVNIAALTKLSVGMAEMVVVRPDGCCGLRVEGRLRIE